MSDGRPPTDEAAHLARFLARLNGQLDLVKPTCAHYAFVICDAKDIDAFADDKHHAAYTRDKNVRHGIAILMPHDDIDDVIGDACANCLASWQRMKAKLGPNDMRVYVAVEGWHYTAILSPDTLTGVMQGKVFHA